MYGTKDGIWAESDDHFLITDLDNEIHCSQLLEIANKNKDSSLARQQYRSIMERLRHNASFGETSLTFFQKQKLESRVITYLACRNGLKVELCTVPDPLNVNEKEFGYRISIEDDETKKRNWENLNTKDLEDIVPTTDPKVTAGFEKPKKKRKSKKSK